MFDTMVLQAKSASGAYGISACSYQNHSNAPRRKLWASGVAGITRLQTWRARAVWGLVVVLACATSMSSQAMSAYKTPFTAQSDLALLSEKGVLPRNINLKTFDPHRAEFVCAHAATKAPALKPEAQALFEEGMALTSPALWPNERNWPRAMALWSQAAEQGHWKAALMWIQTARTGNGVNGPKGQFQVPPQDRELVVSRVEYLMRQGVADGFYLMGVFHEEAYGVKPSVDRAWAFWELAADMGSARAQTKIGKSLNADQDFPNRQKWGNQKVAWQLFECAHAQGYGPAGYELGLSLDLFAEGGYAKNGDKEAQFARARQVLHDATKFGSEDAANYLSSAFSAGDPLVGRIKDPTRAERYSLLGDALFNNPDLRFPNLDKVLPLPPAKLPVWDGQHDSLINAAKGVRETPTQKPSAANVRDALFSPPEVE